MLTPLSPQFPFSDLSNSLLSDEPTPAPTNYGKVSLLVERPEINKRNVVPEAYLTVQNGMSNSGWVENPERGKIDQICVMSTAAIRAITGGDEEWKWAEAGDQIFMDFELGKHNLQTGDRVKVGEKGVVLEVTEKPHTGCAKFSKRFGVDALKVVSTPLAKERRIRGIYFAIIKEGPISTGDEIVKVPSDYGNP